MQRRSRRRLLRVASHNHHDYSSQCFPQIDDYSPTCKRWRNSKFGPLFTTHQSDPMLIKQNSHWLFGTVFNKTFRPPQRGWTTKLSANHMAQSEFFSILMHGLSSHQTDTSVKWESTRQCFLYLIRWTSNSYRNALNYINAISTSTLSFYNSQINTTKTKIR